MIRLLCKLISPVQFSFVFSCEIQAPNLNSSVPSMQNILHLNISLTEIKDNPNM